MYLSVFFLRKKMGIKVKESSNEEEGRKEIAN